MIDEAADPTWLPEQSGLLRSRPSTRTPPSPPARARRTNAGSASAAFRPQPHRPCRGASSSRTPDGRLSRSQTRCRRLRHAAAAIAPQSVGVASDQPYTFGTMVSRRRRMLEARIMPSGVGPGLGHCLPPAAPSTLRMKGALRSFQELRAASPAPFTLRHCAKQLTQFTTARPRTPAPMAGSRCSRNSLLVGWATYYTVQVGLSRCSRTCAAAAQLPITVLRVLVAACFHVGTRERSRGSLQ